MSEVIDGSYHALRAWDDRRIQQALELKPGRTWAQVAEAMGSTPSAVATATSRYELVDGKAVLKERIPRPSRPDNDHALVIAIGEALWGDRWIAAMSRALDMKVKTVEDIAAGRFDMPKGAFADLQKIVKLREKEIERVAGWLSIRVGD